LQLRVCFGAGSSLTVGSAWDSLVSLGDAGTGAGTGVTGKDGAATAAVTVATSTTLMTTSAGRLRAGVETEGDDATGKRVVEGDCASLISTLLVSLFLSTDQPETTLRAAVEEACSLFPFLLLLLFREGSTGMFTLNSVMETFAGVGGAHDSGVSGNCVRRIANLLEDAELVVVVGVSMFVFKVRGVFL